jgi:hypothetical protein
MRPPATGPAAVKLFAKRQNHHYRANCFGKFFLPAGGLGWRHPRGIYVVRDQPYVPLGCETDRILRVLDQMEMHSVAQDGREIFLEGRQPFFS